MQNISTSSVISFGASLPGINQSLSSKFRTALFYMIAFRAHHADDNVHILALLKKKCHFCFNELFRHDLQANSMNGYIPDDSTI